MGWKTNKSVYDCKDEREAKLMKCVEQNSLSISDISLQYTEGYPGAHDFDHYFDASSNESIDIRTLFVNHVNGNAFRLLPHPGVVTEKMTSTVHLFMNNTFSYYFIISDPKLIVATARPDSVPTIMLKLERDIGRRYLFIKVKLIIKSMDQMFILGNKARQN